MTETGDFQFAGTDRFKVISRLGAGGMGEVFEVFDRQTETRVALKRLRAINAESLLRFKEEFRAIQHIKNDHLVHLGELIEDAGQWFFTMELVDGVNFVRYVRDDLVADAGGMSFSSFAADRGKSNGNMAFEKTDRSPQTSAGKDVAPLRFDQIRLRAALAQLVEAVEALHGANKIHRDVKPSNILVNRAGRVVLLDFGFVADMVSEGHTTGGIVVGTADYMAPEQAAGREIGPPADWYAVGVVLYRALTGKLPYFGSRLEVLMNKQQFPPPRPRELAPGVPRDLDEICVRLMGIIPKRRATGQDVLERLGGAPAAKKRAKTEPPQDGVLFVGRQREQALLTRGFVDVVGGASRLIYVTGESGVGKSSLVERFAKSITATEPRSVVLAGRCHERESVPYKAVDGVVDALSMYMRHLSATDVAALLPLHVPLLAQIFPVLRRVEAIAQFPRPATDSLDPRELRRRAFAALRELLARLGERRDLVVVIEDLQWADGDSLALLRDVLQPPESPSFLLVASARTESGDGVGQARGRLHQLVPEGSEVEVEHIHLEGLPPSEARELAAKLIEHAVGSGRLEGAEEIASEAGGHPLFIDELVRHTIAEGSAATGLAHLEDALWARINRLAPVARQVLEAVAVAGSPLAQETIAAAANLEYGTFAAEVSRMRAENLIRTTGTRAGDAIEAYHARVRDAVIAHLPAEQLREHHGRLAFALEAAGGTDLESLAVHWFGAGDPERAGHYAEEAAGHAADALAFVRAARLYRQSIEWRPVEGAFGRRMRTRLGDALANAGHGAEAAEAYLAAAEGSSVAAELELRRLAADQLLRCGHIDEGLDALHDVLAAAGMKLATSGRGALFSLWWGRLRLRMRGLRYQERDATQVSLEALNQLDICWSVSQGLFNVDFLRGAAYQNKHLMLALTAGEPHRVCRALVARVLYTASGGEIARRVTGGLLKLAEEIAERRADHHSRGLVRLARGVNRILRGRWRRGVDDCDAAEEILRDRCTNVWWERNSAQVFSHWALAMLGEIEELSARVRARLREAEERGDLFAATDLRTGLPNLVWLAADDPLAARNEADRAMRSWSDQGFHRQHFYDLVAQVQIDLYEGKEEQAYRRMQEGWLPLRRSGLLRIEQIRILALHLRFRATVSVARSEPAALQEAERSLGLLGRETAEWARPLASLAVGGLAMAQGDRERAAAKLREAADRLEDREMGLYAAAARWRQGELAGDEAGSEARARAGEWMESQGIAEPERMVSVLAPGTVDC